MLRRIPQDDLEAQRCASRDAAAVSPGAAGAERVESAVNLAARFAAFRERQIRVLEQIVAGASLARTFEAVVRMIQEQSPGTLASLLVLDPDGVHLRHGASPDLPAEYSEAIDGIAIGPCVGSCGTAAFRKQRVIVSDIATDPLWENFKGIALQHGLAACWSEPILCSEGKVLGTFAMYYPHAKEPNPEDLQIISVAAHLAALAIERERAEKDRQVAEREREQLERESVERERIEAAVRESEERYALVERATNDGVWDWNLATGSNYLSPQWKALLGFENEGLPNREESFFARIHPEDEAVVREAVRLHLEENQPYSVKLRLRCKDGSYRWFESRGQAIRDAAGRGLRMVGAMSDITERKLAKQRLLVQYAVTRVLSDSPSLAEAAPRIMQAICETIGWEAGAIWRVCPTENLLRCVDLWHAETLELGEFLEATRKIMFAPGVGMPGRVWQSGEPEWIRDLATTKNVVRASVAARVGLHGGFGFPIRSGGVVLGILEAFSHEIREPDPGLLQLMGSIGGQIGQFIERKHAEEELKLMSNRLLLATRAASIGVWDFDPLNNILIWDDQMFRVFGVPPERFTGAYEAWQATVHPEDLPRAMEEVQRALEGKDQFDTEFRIIWPDHSIRHIKANASVQRDAAGKAVHMIGTNWDITAQKRAAEELSRTVAELARSNADLAQFASVASHDLQEPLRAVVGCVELLERRYRDKLDDQARELIAHTVNGTRRMQTLIRDLLEYSRVGTRGNGFEATDAGAALERALANLATAIHESGATVTHDPLPTVVADPTQLTQLFQNLVGNALKFCKERCPEIHVGAQAEGGDWTLSVRDAGIGIEPQYRERIFEIFQRLHTRTEFPGTGIGLAICQRIVERHGGRIWVESQPGLGSTFYFTLPNHGDPGL